MGSTALIVAGVAAGLLVLTLGVDAAMTTTYYLDVNSGSAWRELTRQPYVYENMGREPYPYGPITVNANRSDDVQFRLRIDNGYAWAKTHSFNVLHVGEPVAEGALEVPARSQRTHEFSVPAERLLTGGGSTMREAVAKPIENTTPTLAYADLSVQVDGVYLYANFQLREVSAS